MRVHALVLAALLSCAAEHGDLDECSPFNQASCIGIVACGDSITHGRDVDEGHDWPTLLNQALGYHFYRLYADSPPSKRWQSTRRCLGHTAARSFIEFGR